MYTVIGCLVENYPMVTNCYVLDSKEKALKVALQLCKEQGALDSDGIILAELLEDGVFRPTKHSEWSVTIWEGSKE